MSRSTGTTGRGVARLTVRSVAVGLLLFGVAGAAGVADRTGGGQPQAGPPVETAAYQLELAELQRQAEANEQIDRGRRAALETAESERVSRADAVRSSPAPAPPPEPAPTSPATTNPVPANPAGPVPDSCSDYSGNRATGCTLLLEAGFSLDQMSCLDNLWTRESGWNHLAQNPSSGAYGIPQSLPGDKMASHGDDWRTNPVTQIRWGLSYIANRYGTPCSAWGFFQANNWY